MDQEAQNAHATRCSKILLGCYRTGDANDPELYVSAVVATLAKYPQHVMETVVSPLLGLPARLKWQPSIAELREACEELMAPLRQEAEIDKRREQQQQQLAKQFAEREAFEKARKTRPNYQQLRARHDGPNGEKWGIENADKPTPTRERARNALINLIGKEAFDNIPDNPAADFHKAPP